MPESLTYVLGVGQKNRDPAATKVDDRDQLLTMSSVHICTLTNVHMHITHMHIHPCIHPHIHPGTHARNAHTTHIQTFLTLETS